MAPTPEQTAAGYRKLWGDAVVKANKVAEAATIAKNMLAKRARYEAIEKKTGVPWFMIAVLHMRESSMNFARHLHNGDPLAARTRQVPAGRPETGNPPFTWEESAIDALTMKPHALHMVKPWTLERLLYEIEKYNGWGYLGKTNSPYLWSWTSEYTGGKYVADHVFSKTAVDPQPGCVALLKALATLDAGVAARLAGKPVEVLKPIPPPPDIPKAKPAPAKPQPAPSGGLLAAILRLFGR